jgi:hypothetical protein
MTLHDVLRDLPSYAIVHWLGDREIRFGPEALRRCTDDAMLNLPAECRGGFVIIGDPKALLDNKAVLVIELPPRVGG